MTITVEQAIESRYVPNKSAEIAFVIKGAISEAHALSELELSGKVCDHFEGIPQKDITIEAEHVDQDHPSNNIWRATVSYITPTVTILDKVSSFDTTGHQQRITQSLSTVVYGPSAPDMAGAIGFDGERVNGVDVVTRAYQFALQEDFGLSSVNESFRRTIANLTGTVNDRTFQGFDAGEVLFKGAQGSIQLKNGANRWVITYYFARSPTRNNFYVGNIKVIEKMGWDYLWVYYEDTVESNQLIKQPKGVYIEQIYDYGNFNLLRV